MADLMTEIMHKFHELWGQAQSSPDYDKRKWVEFDPILADLVRVTEKVKAENKEA